MPDTGRLPDASTLTSAELERTRRDLAAALALARPGSPTRLPIGTHLAAIDAELATRTSQREAPAPSSPVEEVRTPLEDTRHLRMALELLEERMPPPTPATGSNPSYGPCARRLTPPNSPCSAPSNTANT